MQTFQHLPWSYCWSFKNNICRQLNWACYIRSLPPNVSVTLCGLLSNLHVLWYWLYLVKWRLQFTDINEWEVFRRGLINKLLLLDYSDNVIANLKEFLWISKISFHCFSLLLKQLVHLLAHHCLFTVKCFSFNFNNENCKLV